YAWKRSNAMGPASYYGSMFVNKIAGTTDGQKALKSIDQVKNFGAVAKDDNTIVITLKEKCAYFPSLLTNTTFYPLREDVVNKGKDPLKSDWSDQKNVPTNGAFTASEINAKDKIVLT
ncbi:MAG: peptide ABC transporter substrate-binding protein, partial [Coprobacillus sp.]